MVNGDYRQYPQYFKTRVIPVKREMRDRDRQTDRLTNRDSKKNTIVFIFLQNLTVCIILIYFPSFPHIRITHTRGGDIEFLKYYSFI